MKADTMSDEPIRPGYKRTEVGIIPEDWEVTTIGDIFRVSAAGDLDKTRFSAIRDANYDKPIYSNALENKGLYGYASYSIYPAGTITVTARGTLGFAVFRDHDYVAIGRLLILEPSRKLDSRYFTEWINNRITFAVESTGVPQLTAPQISKYRLPLPSQLEQHVIADVLSDVDALLDALDRLIAKKRMIKQGAMQALLTGGVRLPGFAGTWEYARLGDLGKCLRGVSYKGETDLFPYDTPESIRLLRANNLQNASLDLSDLQYVNRKCVSTQQVLHTDDIVICMANGSKDLVGKTARFDVEDAHDYTYGAFMGCFRVMSEQALPLFISLLLQGPAYQNHIFDLIAGSSINNLKPSDIESVQFQIPPISEQAAIAEVLSDMDAEIDALEKRRAKLRDIKQGMMQELLTGRIRLVQPQQQAQEVSI